MTKAILAAALVLSVGVVGCVGNQAPIGETEGALEGPNRDGPKPPVIKDRIPPFKKNGNTYPLTLIDTMGRAFSFRIKDEGWRDDVNNLKPGECKTFKGAVWVSKPAPGGEVDQDIEVCKTADGMGTTVKLLKTAAGDSKTQTDVGTGTEPDASDTSTVTDADDGSGDYVDGDFCLGDGCGGDPTATAVAVEQATASAKGSGGGALPMSYPTGTPCGGTMICPPGTMPIQVHCGKCLPGYPVVCGIPVCR